MEPNVDLLVLDANVQAMLDAVVEGGGDELRNAKSLLIEALRTVVPVLSSHRALVECETDIAKRVVRADPRPVIVKDVAVNGLHGLPVLQLQVAQAWRSLQKIGVNLDTQGEGVFLILDSLA